MPRTTDDLRSDHQRPKPNCTSARPDAHTDPMAAPATEARSLPTLDSPPVCLDWLRPRIAEYTSTQLIPPRWGSIYAIRPLLLIMSSLRKFLPIFVAIYNHHHVARLGLSQHQDAWEVKIHQRVSVSVISCENSIPTKHNLFNYLALCFYICAAMKRSRDIVALFLKHASFLMLSNIFLKSDK